MPLPAILAAVAAGGLLGAGAVASKDVDLGAGLDERAGLTHGARFFAPCRHRWYNKTQDEYNFQKNQDLGNCWTCYPQC